MTTLAADLPPLTSIVSDDPTVAAAADSPFKELSPLLARAGRRAFWPLADQGVVSLGNILTILLVGRGIALSDFGTFTLILEAMFFLTSMHTGLISYPLTIKGAVADDCRLRHLATASLLLTLLLAVPVSIAALVVGSFYRMPAVGLMAAAALAIWQMQEATRRAMLSHFRHAKAIWGDAISYLGQAAGLLILHRIGHLTLVTAFAAIGFSSAIALAVQTTQLGLVRLRIGELIAVAREFWIAGRWIALTNLNGLCLMVCGNWALGWSHGREEVAAYAAIATLLKICNPVLQTIAGLITPAAAKALAAEDMEAARRIALRFAALGAVMLAPFYLILAVAPHWCLWIAFQGRYDSPEHQQALRLLVAGNIFIFLVIAMTSFFNGVHRARFTFLGQLAGSAAMFGVLLPMNIAYGWTGSVIGGLLQTLIQFFVLLWLLRTVNGVPRASWRLQDSRSCNAQSYA